MHKTWARAEQVRSCKESHQIFPSDEPPPRRLSFSSSFEKEQPSMSLLLGWEYGRLWLKEHEEFVTKELTNAKPPYIDPDFDWWVNKRTAVMDRRQYYLKNKQNPHMKNCNLSAFAAIKTHRQKKERGSAAESEKQRISGGKENSSLRVNSTMNSSVNDSSSSAAIVNASSNFKSKKCKCKDCVQRRKSGQEIKSGSYGPDNRKVFYVTQKLLSMPWY
ncbi:uncharacterized protein LOC132790994 [Drosophila nasuta]|uniref:uncharacterized protein LOC132790994 n=1 Tax=Drosophila nasuta TaxID=42062 RepID=UPI00295E401D|nr:uncharacterized protein LOC132790994 [Drosophila nasuta]